MAQVRSRENRDGDLAGLEARLQAPERGDQPRRGFRAALARYRGSRLAAIRLAQGGNHEVSRLRTGSLADEITEGLDSPSVLSPLIDRLSHHARQSLCFFDLADLASIPLKALVQTLELLGAPPSALLEPLELGLLAIEADPSLPAVDDLTLLLERGLDTTIRVRIHPAVALAVKTPLPAGKAPSLAGAVVQPRESDGLEPLVRMAALWQRAFADPLRQTQYGALYKRDRDRIEGDPVLAGPSSLSIAPIADIAAFSLAMALRVGFIMLDPGGERLTAAPFDDWIANAVHLPRMIASGWLGLESWREFDPEPGGGDPIALRLAALLWLAPLSESEWTTLESLADHLLIHRPEADQTEPADTPSPGARRPRSHARSAVSPAVRTLQQLEAVLLGSAYFLGLVRVAEERGTGRRAVQLSPLGRYVLSVGPSPTPPALFEQFLFVQPNFEIIAYRQGLSPRLIGRLSRFAWWTKIGSALELAISRESVVQGLELGETAATMIETLAKHSHRPMPASVADAVSSWSARREQVTLHESATLIEFATELERDQAAEQWPTQSGQAPVAVADRFLLVEDERTVPFDRLRLTSTRDYRQPPGVCFTVLPDGLTVVLDPSRSDLLALAEIGRFAERVLHEVAASESFRPPDPPRFLITQASLKSALERGLSPRQIIQWFERRAGTTAPPAVTLLLAAIDGKSPPIRARRLIVIELPTAELLDGLFQHPATAGALGERLGPTTAEVPGNQIDGLTKTLRALGLRIEVEELNS